MWFVIATETPELLQQALDRIEQEANLPVYNFPSCKPFTSACGSSSAQTAASVPARCRGR